MSLSLVWTSSTARLQGDQLDPGPLSPDDPDAGSGQTKIIRQGRYDLPVGFSLFRRSQHVHFVFALAELLDPGCPATGLGPDGPELFAGLAFTLHRATRLSSETDLQALEQPMGVEGQGVHQDAIEENK